MRGFDLGISMDLSSFPIHSTDISCSAQRSSLGLEPSPTAISNSDEALFASYVQDPAFYQQQFDLAASLEAYNITPQTEVELQWTLSHQELPASSANLPIQPTLPALAPRLDTAPSVKSEEDEDNSEPTSPHEGAMERRKERRRAQNRAAQRAFRARKEDTIKESTARLELLQEELVRLSATNGSLTETVAALQREITVLQQENALLRDRPASRKLGWPALFADDEESSPRRPSISQQDSGLGLNFNGSVVGHVNWQDGSRSTPSPSKTGVGTVMDAAAQVAQCLF